MLQMMPLNWLMLFSFFSTLFNVMNYYAPFNKTTSLPPIKTSIKTLIWKW